MTGEHRCLHSDDSETKKEHRFQSDLVIVSLSDLLVACGSAVANTIVQLQPSKRSRKHRLENESVNVLVNQRWTDLYIVYDSLKLKLHLHFKRIVEFFHQTSYC